MGRLDWACVGLIGVAAGALVGCSSSTSGGASTMDSGTSDSKKDTGSGSPEAGKDGSPGKDGSSSEGGSGSCERPDGTGKTYSGVILLSNVTEPTPATYGILGAFYSGIVHSDACNGMMVGACCYQTPASVPGYTTAGTLTVSDGATMLATIPAPATPGPYISGSELSASVTWAPGDTLKLDGSGGTVDAFTLSVVAPALLTGVSPALTAGLTVPTSADFVVTWTLSSQSCAKVLFGLSQGTGMPEIGCTVDDSAGTVSVPASLLGMFTAATGSASIQRIETAGVLNANSVVGVVASNVQFQKSVTYTK